jgi:hypothetical protein
MHYYTDLFSPETYKAFSQSSREISGFRVTQKGMSARIRPGDRFLCYVTRLSRWVGVLEVVEGPFEDSTPIFVAGADPFTLRFRVKPIAWLPLEQAIPIHDDLLWNELSFTRGQPLTSSKWTGQVRNSLRTIDPKDGALIERLILEQATSPKPFPLTEEDLQALERSTVRRAEGEVQVVVPPSEPLSQTVTDPKSLVSDVRESIQIQALLARIGATMGMKVWIPASDRARVLEEWPEGKSAILATLPLNYNDTTIATIERIDVLWLKGRAIQRAFEVEHTTSVYSGILRMADLLALQPNMDIRLHIVAPDARRQKVFDEIRRPVFSLLERQPLAEICTFLSYDAVREIGELRHLGHLSDGVLDEYAQEAE